MFIGLSKVDRGTFIHAENKVVLELLAIAQLLVAVVLNVYRKNGRCSHSTTVMAAELLVGEFVITVEANAIKKHSPRGTSRTTAVFQPRRC